MKQLRIDPLTHGVTGWVHVPGDKSISHRSVMFSALGRTPVHITNFLHAADCLTTVSCMQALGAEVKMLSDTELVVRGNDLHGLLEPQGILDAGNSGTTLRLLLGLLAPQPFYTTFTGDASLSKRPMGRVIEPLTQMGARIVGRKHNTVLPITVSHPGAKLHGMVYESPVASAQVKSALLLAGMFADGPTTVVEPVTSRDHTEKMLAAFGVETEKQGTAVTIHPVRYAEYRAPEAIEVPGDISSAAYWIVLAALVPGSKLMLENIGTNTTRTGILDVLTAMGAHIELTNVHTSGGEESAQIVVTPAKLHGTTFGKEMMPRLIDEIPVIAVAALFAEGDTVITGAGELRVKETDRLQAIEQEWNTLAPGSVETDGDTLVIHGGTPVRYGMVHSYDDHRMAMSLAILGAAGAGVIIDRPDCVNISYPEFYQTLRSVERQG